VDWEAARDAALGLLCRQVKRYVRAGMHSTLEAVADAHTGVADAHTAWSLASGLHPDTLCPVTGRWLAPSDLSAPNPR
jgi:hypothetical protein